MARKEVPIYMYGTTVGEMCAEERYSCQKRDTSSRGLPAVQTKFNCSYLESSKCRFLYKFLLNIGRSKMLFYLSCVLLRCLLALVKFPTELASSQFSILNGSRNEKANIDQKLRLVGRKLLEKILEIVNKLVLEFSNRRSFMVLNVEQLFHRRKCRKSSRLATMMVVALLTCLPKGGSTILAFY